MASEASGRRATKVQRSFGRHRSLLLERLDPEGPVTNLPSWQALVRDIERFVAGT